jgi:hypothetical protein
MKCLWILNGLQSNCDELTKPNADPIWVAYIKNLEQVGCIKSRLCHEKCYSLFIKNVSQECGRFAPESPHPLKAPNIDSINLPEEFDPWMEFESADFLSPQQDTTNMEEIMTLLVKKTSLHTLNVCLILFFQATLQYHTVR